MDIKQLLQTALDQKASDLHISAGNPPIFRLNGRLRRADADILSDKDIQTALKSIMSKEELATFKSEREIDFSIDYEKLGRFRVNAFHNHTGASAVFRTVPTEVQSLDEIGAPPILHQLAEIDKGLILITGPAGSGKSTTITTMLNHLNQHYSRHILTIEDPIEYVHTPKRSLINHREIGRDTKSLERALQSASREDPDVIMIGELRSHEDFSLALDAAEAGHLVLAGIRTAAAARTLEQIISLYPEVKKERARNQLASTLQAVVSQVILRRADTGSYIAAFEVLTGTPAVRNQIRDNQLPQIFSMMQMGHRFGMQTMANSIESLVKRGIVTENEGWRGLMAASGEDDAEGRPSLDNNDSNNHLKLSRKTNVTPIKQAKKSKKPAKETTTKNKNKAKSTPKTKSKSKEPTTTGEDATKRKKAANFSFSED